MFLKIDNLLQRLYMKEKELYETAKIEHFYTYSANSCGT